MEICFFPMIFRQTHNNKTGDWTPKNQDLLFRNPQTDRKVIHQHFKASLLFYPFAGCHFFRVSVAESSPIMPSARPCEVTRSWPGSKCRQLSANPLVVKACPLVDHMADLPGLVNIQKAMENGHRNSGFSHEKWWFSIAMLVHQRVISLPICLTPNFGPHVGIGLRQSWENYVDSSHTSCPKKPGRGSKSWFCTCRTDHQITVSQNAFCPSVHRQTAGGGSSNGW